MKSVSTFIALLTQYDCSTFEPKSQALDNGERQYNIIWEGKGNTMNGKSFQGYGLQSEKWTI